MVLKDMIRDAPLGQVVRWLTKNQYFKYPDEEPGFQLPETWQQLLNNTGPVNVSGEKGHDNEGNGNGNGRGGVMSSADSARADSAHGENYTAKDDEKSSNNGLDNLDEKTEPKQHAEDDEERQQQNAGMEKTQSVPQVTKDGIILVEWYGEDDKENPHNWSNAMRAFTVLVLFLYTFIVYATSAIFTTSEPGVMERFGVGQIAASLGLALYVLGYGMGPMVFSPLGEVPRIGRGPVYAVTMILFVILSLPTAFAPNFAGLLVLRFLQGFFGSPCLASGGATLGDMYSITSFPFAMMAWVTAAYCGPALGPLISGFAVPAENWRWSLYESIWASGPIMIVMLVMFPETSGPNILLRRARRLRRLTGDKRLMSQDEVNQHHLEVSQILVDALIKPMEITIKDPAVLFVQLYMGIVYCVYYSFFEAFPLVYPTLYHMNSGEVGLVFVCISVANMIGMFIYFNYLWFYLRPYINNKGFPVQEHRLIPAIPASVITTGGLFIFAWTARADIHWIVPTIGITVYAAAAFVLVQCIFIYVPFSYPQYAASLFAANDFIRSAMAFASILYAQPLFAHLGVDRGVSLLAGLSVLGIIGIILLYIYGGRLRALSKFAI